MYHVCFHCYFQNGRAPLVRNSCSELSVQFPVQTCSNPRCSTYQQPYSVQCTRLPINITSTTPHNSTFHSQQNNRNTLAERSSYLSLKSVHRYCVLNKYETNSLFNVCISLNVSSPESVTNNIKYCYLSCVARYSTDFGLVNRRAARVLISWTLSLALLCSSCDRTL